MEEAKISMVIETICNGQKVTVNEAKKKKQEDAYMRAETKGIYTVRTCNDRTVRAMRALSRTPDRLIRVNSTSTIAAAAQVGKWREGTSPAKYSAAVAAETIAVDAKSSSNKVAPIRAKGLVDTFRLKANSGSHQH